MGADWAGKIGEGGLAEGLMLIEGEGGGIFMEEVEEGFGGVAEGAAGGVDEANVALDLEFLNADFLEGAGGEFMFDAHFGEEGDAFVALDEEANGFDGGHFDVHIE